MAPQIEVHAYLAGPDVFFPGAVDIGKEKKAALAKVGIIGHFPYDNEIPAEVFQKGHAANSIGAANEQMMLDCCKPGRVGIILANMIPYKGPSMDVGTAGEMLFMSSQAVTNPNVIIIGYTPDKRTFEERVIAQYGGRDTITEKDGKLFGPDGNMIETFGGADNLMMTHAIEKTGGKVVHSFEEAVALARTLADQKIREMTGPNRFKTANGNGVSKA